MKIKKGDKVRVMAGKDRGKDGVVERVILKKNQLLVPGVNVFKRHSKPKSEGQKGGIVDFVRPLAVAKVALVCPKCKQPTRIGFDLSGKEKVRVCRKCHQVI